MTADKVNKGSNVSRSALNPRIEERMNELWAEVCMNTVADSVPFILLYSMMNT